MISAIEGQHAAAINDLAAAGKISPIEFEFNGKRLSANSVWAATEWLKANGGYQLDQTTGRAKNLIIWLPAKAKDHCYV